MVFQDNEEQFSKAFDLITIINDGIIICLREVRPQKVFDSTAFIKILLLHFFLNDCLIHK